MPNGDRKIKVSLPQGECCVGVVGVVVSQGMMTSSPYNTQLCSLASSTTYLASKSRLARLSAGYKTYDPCDILTHSHYSRETPISWSLWSTTATMCHLSMQKSASSTCVATRSLPVAPRCLASALVIYLRLDLGDRIQDGPQDLILPVLSDLPELSNSRVELRYKGARHRIDCSPVF